MTRPSAEDLNLAAAWLEINDGADGESDACKRVAAWLEHQAENVLIADKSRELGISVKRMRHAMKYSQSAKEAK